MTKTLAPWAVLWCLPALFAAAQPEEPPAALQDEPAAHALYDKMLQTMRSARTLSYESDYRWEADGTEIARATYKTWLKKPNYARLEATYQGKPAGVLVLDGTHFWTYWPNGRPRYGAETPEEYAGSHVKVYMKEPAPPGRHSIGHKTQTLGANMGPTILNPSVFHGCRDVLDSYLDGVKALAAEKVGDEECDVIELSYAGGRQSNVLWLSKGDHLPRRLQATIQASHRIVIRESWTKVALDREIPDDKFSWRPPEGWSEWRPPTLEDGLLKPGAEAPDFDLTSAEGGRIKLSDYRGKDVWLTFWNIECPPCRLEIPHLQELYQEHGEKGVVVIGFNCVDDRGLASGFLEQHSVTFPNVLDRSAAAREVCFSRYQTRKGMSATPLTYLIDREGKVFDAWYGFDEERSEQALQKAGILPRPPSEDPG